MKAYLNYFKLRIITNFQYRAAALAGMSTQLFFGFMYIMLYIALYESNAGVNAPMSLRQLITYMWLGQIFFSLTHMYEREKELIEMIRNGDIAYELIRPQNFYLKFYIKMFASRIVSTLQRCFPILIVSLLLPLEYRLGLPVSINSFIIFLLALILSGLLVTSLTMFIHLCSMFTLDPRGIFGIFSVICEIFMGMVVPIPFLPLIFQKIAYVLPFRFISDFPYRVYVGDISIQTGIGLLGQSLVWLIIVLFVGYKLSKLALKKAVIQGG